MKVKFKNPIGVTARHLKNAVSNDNLRPAMTGVFIDLKEKQLVATQAHVLVCYPIEIEECDTDKEGVIVPLRFFDTLKYMLPITAKNMDAVEYVLTDEYAEVYYFGGLELLYRCRYIDAKYPNYMAVMPSAENTVPVDKFGLNINVMEKFCKAIPRKETMTYKVSLFAPNKAILIESTNGDYDRPIKGIVMPAMLTK